MDLNKDEMEYMPGENPEKLDKAHRDDTLAYCSMVFGKEKWDPRMCTVICRVEGIPMLSLIEPTFAQEGRNKKDSTLL